MNSRDKELPEPKISQEELEDLRRAHADLTGFVSPRTRARTELLARLDPKVLRMQQELRKHCMYPECFDTKSAQLMLFGMLLITLRDAAKMHGLAARRAGATWEEMQAVANLAFLFGGLSVANRAAEIMQEIASMEAERKAQAEE
jgi:alkylhydroperoxidase/carboxymuconolactone decarboxylase family protein YurZ